MTWRLVVDFVIGLLCVGLSANVLVLSRRCRRYEAERAEAAARALGDGMVLVDGHTLPSPSDPRWKLEPRLITWDVVGVDGIKKRQEDQMHAVLGAVSVGPDGAVFVTIGGVGKAPTPRLTTTASTERYAKQVYMHCRNAIVKKALEMLS